MKTIKIVLAIAIGLGVLLFLGSCTSTKTLLSTDNIDELLGTWINRDHDGKMHPTRAKAVWKEDGSVAWYMFVEGGNPRGVNYLDVKEKWMDRKGAVYFKGILDTLEGLTNVLIKVGPDGKVIEYLDASRMEFLPSKMNPDAPYCRYVILYRQ